MANKHLLPPQSHWRCCKNYHSKKSKRQSRSYPSVLRGLFWALAPPGSVVKHFIPDSAQPGMPPLVSQSLWLHPDHLSNHSAIPSEGQSALPVVLGCSRQVHWPRWDDSVDGWFHSLACIRATILACCTAACKDQKEEEKDFLSVSTF